MRLRFISRILVGTLVVVVGLTLFVHDRLAQSHPSASVAKLHGVDMGGDPAPNFTLVDQTGTPVSLQQLRGHPVILTFLYTHCPDVCPLTAEKLHTATQSLGAQTTQVGWLTVSIDPVGDTPAAASGFVAAHHLTGQMRYLLGTQAQLQPVWDAYHIAVKPGSDGQAQIHTVTHSLGVYLIDAHGRERAYFDSTFDPSEVSADLRTLLAS